MRIRYKRGFKFVTVGIVTEYVGIFPPKSICFEWGLLSINGYLTVKDEYPWNGMSGIPLNIKSSVRGVLIHDVLYRLIRLGLLDIKWKTPGDEVLRKFCIEDGMWKWVADTIFAAVQRWGLSSTGPKAEPKIMEAP